MTARTTVHGLQVATELHQFIEQQVLPATGVASAVFWKGFDAIVSEFAPKNLALLAERDRLQAEMDAWHKAHPGPIADMPAYRAFLESIGYLLPQPKDVQTTTANVDAELAQQAGPQLVVPILNARYALNAANARWGSLYDALYGTDVIPESEGIEKGKGYNPARGAKVIEFARHVLDQAAPLDNGSHKMATGYKVEHGQLVIALQSSSTGLKDHYLDDIALQAFRADNSDGQRHQAGGAQHVIGGAGLGAAGDATQGARPRRFVGGKLYNGAVRAPGLDTGCHEVPFRTGCMTPTRQGVRRFNNLCHFRCGHLAGSHRSRRKEKDPAAVPPGRVVQNPPLREKQGCCGPMLPRPL